MPFRTTCTLLALTSAAALTLTAQTNPSLPPASSAKVDYLRDIQPLLAEKCHSCHGPEVQQSGLRLDVRQAAFRGGDYGPVIVPGDSAGSKLIKRLVNGDGGMIMPPTGALATEEIALLRAWIDQGADFRLEVRPERPAKPVDPKVNTFILSIRAQDNKAIAAALAADPELVNAVDAAGSTALHHAAGFGTPATLELLLEKGADPNARNRRKSTPLHWAIHDEAKVRTLVAKGADVNARQAEGRTPLFLAAMSGNAASIIRFLLEKGADPQRATANGQTPLMTASSRANIETMRLLLAAKAQVNHRSGNGSTALIGASQSGSAEAVRILLDAGADPNIRDKKKESALAEAATSGNIESIRLLLSKGAAVNVQDDRGYSPLMYAAASDTIPVAAVKLLLEKGADPKATGEGETAATLAAKRGDTEIARILGVPEEVRKQGGVQVRPVAFAGSIPQAVAKATDLIAKQSPNFIRIGGCNSCHGQDLPSAAAAIARDHGIAAPKEVAQLPNSMRVSPERGMDFGFIGPGSVAWELFDSGSNRVARDAYTDSVVRYLKATQSAEGHWRTNESRRPPMSAGSYQSTALSVYSLQHYSSPAEKADSAKRIAQAATWLERGKPTQNQDRAFQIMGLIWSGSTNRAVIGQATAALIAAQRDDGGWSQLPSMASDAYATGQALYALALASKNGTSTPAYRKGVAYLLRTQSEDGSWHVASRSIWFQPYFESGFPYGHDQWISVAGTAWASMALSVANEVPASTARR